MSRFALPKDWSPQSIRSVRAAMLRWFDRHKRDLPWRANRDPYRIWVSEVMLQQTTVTAVVPYFQRFMNAFPTVHALASADEQQVLRLWEGLGYYRRARHLHAAARRLAAEEAVPTDPAYWAALPGVGRYILGAVLSQAFDRRLPIVEANSLRVYSRLFGYRGDPRTGAGKTWVWQAAQAVLSTKRVGDFNQAVMELGALVCTPTTPGCADCPVARWCAAKHYGLQSRIPPPAKRKDVVAVREVAVVIRRGSKVVLCRRSADASRWANLWEFPHVELQDGESLDEAVARAARALTGLAVTPGSELTTLRHGVTRWAITLTVIEATPTRGRLRPSATHTETTWVELNELERRPLSSPHRQIANTLATPRRQLRLL